MSGRLFASTRVWQESRGSVSKGNESAPCFCSADLDTHIIHLTTKTLDISNSVQMYVCMYTSYIILFD